MLNIPVKNPQIVKAITIAAGVAAVLVAHFAPHYSVLLNDILNVLGIGAIGVGGASFTGKPDDGDRKAVLPTRIHFDNPPDPEAEQEPEPPTAALLMLVVGCALLAGCAGAPTPNPSCSDEAYRNQLLTCSVGAASCVQKGGSDVECGSVCDKEWADWQARCSQ